MIEPLTPPECDLRGLAFMPLDVQRLRDCDLAMISTGDEFKAAVLLWCASWNQVPAASLPDDDRILGKLAGLEAKAWKKAKAVALRGWVKCSDGRMYHPVVAEKALEALPRRQEHSEKKTADTDRKVRERDDRKALFAKLRAAGHVLAYDTPTSRLRDVARDIAPPVTPPVTEPVTPVTPDVTVKTGTGTVITVPNGTGAEAPTLEDDDLTAERSLPVAKGSWRLALRVLTERGGMAEAKARPLISKWINKDGLAVEDLWAISAAAWRLETLDPVPYLTRAAQASIERKALAQGGIDNPSERQQRAWMDDWREKGAVGWRRHERGPFPGESGCRVSPEIQAEQFQSEAA